MEKEAKEWGELRQRLGSGQSSVVSYFLNITAFCKDNNETALEVEQDILNSFRKNGFELISPRFNHMRIGCRIKSFVVTVGPPASSL